MTGSRERDVQGEQVFLEFGGNRGDVEASFRGALSELRTDPRVSNVCTSRLYRTAPWGLKDQPHFLNLVVRLHWDGSLEELFSLIDRVEAKFGRDRETEVRWGPRSFDLDILVFGEIRLTDGPWKIPHPEMANRRFVLIPLADLAPDLVPPGWTATVAEMLEKCSDNGEVEPLTSGPWDDGGTQEIHNRNSTA